MAQQARCFDIRSSCVLAHICTLSIVVCVMKSGRTHVVWLVTNIDQRKSNAPSRFIPRQKLQRKRDNPHKNRKMKPKTSACRRCLRVIRGRTHVVWLVTTIGQRQTNASTRRVAVYACTLVHTRNAHAHTHPIAIERCEWRAHACALCIVCCLHLIPSEPKHRTIILLSVHMEYHCGWLAFPFHFSSSGGGLSASDIRACSNSI